MTPTYEIKLPSGLNITARPFLVKEEKLLLMAAESKDITSAIYQVLENCILEKNINLKNLPYYDINYLMVYLRGKSVGETVKIKFQCNNVVDLENRIVCGATFPVEINLENVTVDKPVLENKIKTYGGHIFVMGHPTYAEIKRNHGNESDFDQQFQLILYSIDSITHGAKVYTKKDIASEAINAREILDNLMLSDYNKLLEWVENFPTMYVKAEHTCEKCGFKHDIKYSDFDSFFL